MRMVREVFEPENSEAIELGLIDANKYRAQKGTIAAGTRVCIESGLDALRRYCVYQALGLRLQDLGTKIVVAGARNEEMEYLPEPDQKWP